MSGISRRDVLKSAAIGVAAMSLQQKLLGAELGSVSGPQDKMLLEFVTPPDEARPWVYWYFMDGHLTREGMAADLETMKKAGLGGGIFIEAGIGIEPGPVEFMSEPWQELLEMAFSKADSLGLQLSLVAGPGWCGAGGPWVKPDQSMQHLVSSRTVVHGPSSLDVRLAQPPPRTPFFGEDTLSPDLLKVFKEFYRDEYVLAFPTPEGSDAIADVDEKALYTRGSYSSQIPGPYTKRAWVRPFLPSSESESVSSERCVASQKVVNLTGKLEPDGRLKWNVPEGSWTILRFGRTLTGQTTRPSPKPGLGLESDKFDAGAMDAHFDAYLAPLLKKTGAPRHPGRGLVSLHYDSWEMSSQNWSPHFAEEFRRRRGYHPVAMLPAFAGLVVDTPEVSERFLWDIRQTAQELVRENQAMRLRERGKSYGLSLVLEPYDLNPAADLELGSTADVPMGEFWSRVHDDPPTDFSIAEAVSVGHTQGHTVIAAEAFTAIMEERGHQHPATMKAQGDWAFCQGINKFVIHRYQAQPWLDRFPGMTMGPNGGYGVHWERTQTWWDFAPAYHTYISRCQQMLRRGLPVADILYLTPEGAPCVFFPPRSVFLPGLFADRRGYNFDGCAPGTLIARATVSEGRIVFPDGMSYALLVLPRFQTMTPRLLETVVKLVEDGATIVGAPPLKSPSLSNYPDCDHRVHELAAKLWQAGDAQSYRTFGKGRVYFDRSAFSTPHTNPFADAIWIWSKEENAPGATYPHVTFMREFDVDKIEEIEFAQVTVTADKSYSLTLNSRFIRSGNAVERASHVDISGLLRTGSNQLQIRVDRNIDKARRSGLIASLDIRYRNGKSAIIRSDRQWTCFGNEIARAEPATELGSWAMAPWSLTDSAIEQDDIYPSYSITAAILLQMGIKSDFDAEGLIRCNHRREGVTDIYFLANGESHPQTAICRFRATGRQPEWWDPLTGTYRDLPDYSERDGQTEIPMRLDALESGFVVFRKSAETPSEQRGANFRKLEIVSTLGAPWRVSFDPRWGGPESIAFAQLDDWSQRSEPGIRHYSGKASYRLVFDCDRLEPKLRYFISLGKVANIASVKINNHDLGIAWCEPWSLPIPAGVLQRRGNSLEIVVANLWTNRLIGDSNLPPEQRLTWITGNPFHPDDPLLESGLLGPVTIQASESPSTPSST